MSLLRQMFTTMTINGKSIINTAEPRKLVEMIKEIAQQLNDPAIPADSWSTIEIKFSRRMITASKDSDEDSFNRAIDQMIVDQSLGRPMLASEVMIPGYDNISVEEAAELNQDSAWTEMRSVLDGTLRVNSLMEVQIQDRYRAKYAGTKFDKIMSDLNDEVRKRR